MSDKPRRAWFQIHLSTAIVLMFVAGGLIWANFAGQERRWIGTGEGQIDVFMIEYGWPKICFSRTEYQAPPTVDHWNFLRLAINFLTALFILAAVTFICELLNCRHKARAL